MRIYVLKYYCCSLLIRSYVSTLLEQTCTELASGENRLQADGVYHHYFLTNPFSKRVFENFC